MESESSEKGEFLVSETHLIDKPVWEETATATTCQK